MNNKTLIATKKLFDALAGLLNRPYIHNILLEMFPTLDFEPDQILFIDSLRFMLFIASADEQITQKEANIINYITGKYMSVSKLNEYVSRSDIMPTNFENTVPLTAQIFLEIENHLCKINRTVNSSVGNIIIPYFQQLGLLFVKAESDFDSIRTLKINPFINQIKKYFAENTLSPFFEE